MKSIFSKTGNNKTVSGKMDRRTVVVNGNVPNQAVVSPNTGRVTSFIPTVASYQTTHMSNGHPKHIVAPQQQQQQIPQPHNHHPNHFYSNIPGFPGNMTITRQQEHHYNNANYQHQRTLTKSYSSSHNQNPIQQQQSHYGNTLYAGNSNSNHNQSTFYGNTANLPNGAVIMNGHHGGEKNVNVTSSHHPSEMIGQVQNIQNPYGNSHHQMQNKIHVQNNRIIHHNNNHFDPPSSAAGGSNNNNSNNNSILPNAVDGLPPTLVESMRTLFDILDDSKQGKIRLSDIETRWESDTNNGLNGKACGAEPLIKMGVLEYLRKVTPADGMLTFDRFCSGLRLALLTNGTETQEEEPPVTGTMNPAKLQRPSNLPPQQQYFQEQMRNMANSGKSNNQSVINVNGTLNTQKSTSVVQPSVVVVQSNTMQRLSKIPNFSSSRLPMPNAGNNNNAVVIPSSGIPLSPGNRANTIPMANSNKSHQHASHTGTLNNAVKRTMPHTTDQQSTTTTVALVHPQPPSIPKPTTVVPYNNDAKGQKQTTGGFLQRFSSKNSSLDDLHVPNNEPAQCPQPPKDRPPSAPILDAESPPNPTDSNKSILHNQIVMKQKNRERAKSQERDRIVNNNNSHFGGRRAEEKANFVKSRQRTLSMPQLQMNKLKSKTTVNFEENTTNNEKTSSASPIEQYPKPSNLKNHSLSKLLAGGHQYGTAIPTTTPSSNNNTLRYSNKGESNKGEAKESKQDLPPPPPKPPRNAMNGVTISTTLVTGLTQDPPLSGSSFGSATLSLSTVSSTGSGAVGMGKPEIRSVLNTWQKSLHEKQKNMKSSTSNANVAINNSMTTTVNGNTDTLKSVPTVITGNTGMGGNGSINTGDDTKLKQPTKSSLKRKETARRHTVQSGIDFSILKRLKQLEQEREILQQGLQYLEKANHWFLKQMEDANDKINLLSKGAPTSEYWSESNEERLNLLGCRITEVNSLLTSLMDGSSQLPIQMNLQIPSHLSLRTITRLKDQNRQLTQEVSDYSNRITQLEKEKGLLLRQLFHQKSSSNSDETVYM